MKDFPINVFPDVERDEFKKYTKKNVTEDYIKENLKRKGWDCFKPFSDVGLDLVAMKVVDGKMIYRYIQIKTRALKDNAFGYTLTPKDFITDPRKFYCLYCDTTDDVFLISTYDYLKMCDDNYAIGMTHFGSPSFRTYNNKLNSLKYNARTKVWSWTYRSLDGHPGNTVFFDKWQNDNGLKLMESSEIDNNLDKYLKLTTDLKYKLFYRFNKTPANSILFDGITDHYVLESLKNNINRTQKNYIDMVELIKESFKKNYPELFKSHLKYEKDEGEESNE